MQIICVHDPDRQPPSWTRVIRPGQFVGFAKFADGGGSGDADGRPFASPAATTRVLFDTLDEARAFCDERVRTHRLLQMNSAIVAGERTRRQRLDQASKER